jgi:hypothetical protein
VREALLAPTAVFRGVREEGERDWLCYVSRPGRAYDYRTGEEVDGWEGQVFLIYVTDDRILYLWVWAQADGDNPNLPVNYASRFEERLL